MVQAPFDFDTLAVQSAPELDLIVQRLRAATAVQVVGHVRPDGDCIGSMLALHELLEAWNIPHAMAAPEMVPGGYHVLKDCLLIRPQPEPPPGCDCVVYLDCAAFDRSIQWTPPAPIINIDHHGSNTRYGELNWVEPDCAATGEMIFYLARHAGAAIGTPMAEALLIAVTTDTGSFRFSNTGPRQHRIAAHLIEAGASAERVARIAYATHSPEALKLAGHVLSQMRLECEGRLAWSEIRQETMTRFAQTQAPENLADSLRAIEGVELALLFHEMPGGALRLNLRAQGGGLNVSRLAAEWGGGGHPAAAGVYLCPAEYERDRDRILARLREAVAGQ